MQSILRGYSTMLTYLNRLVGYAIGIMLAVMSILIFWQVFARFVVGESLTFSEEISRFLMIWMTMLGTAYAIREGSLIAIEMLPEVLKGKGQRILRVISEVVATIFYIVLIIYGWQMAEAVQMQTAPSTRISMFWSMLALPVGGIFMLLNSLGVISKQFLIEKGGE
ncbi:TRAP transporter small permease [Guptibacillus hwajinpoensis]|uniref:TRAP transporter small permease n=1 Tax=Guptibacillus hwajinpoensis TaxID=208199 RepID=UPI00273D5A9A|nr:TRAP transporter small permease [Pseudalkalibacillus hwajinpoensis]WLR61009.1 TRAP transporter small permease [Pseudalkalibacillus hwajinpoensis]